jgi:DNA-binding PadR family transcriptional regulator
VARFVAVRFGARSGVKRAVLPEHRHELLDARPARLGPLGVVDPVRCDSVPAPLPELSLSDWVVLGVVAEHPTHGWPVVRELSPDGAIGRIWTVSRPLVYRSLATLLAEGFIEERGDAAGARGPQRTIVGVTRRGKTALRRWLEEPVDHVRDVRGELLAKLALLERAGRPSEALIARQLERLEPVFAAVTRRPSAAGFESVLATWRREQALAVRRFLRSQSH